MDAGQTGGDGTRADQFRKDGVLFPFEVLSEADVQDMVARLETIENARAGRLPPSLNFKPHLLLPRLWELVHSERILEPVRDVLGPDVLCWASSFFDKRPGKPDHVPWHQDATYWGLTKPHAVTAWVAFTPSTRENGCLRVVPGSHARQLAHGRAGVAHNMLPGGEEILVDVDEADAVDVTLGPGEMSLHHLLLIHGSEPNTSSIRRLGFAIRYIAGDLHTEGTVRGSASLVSGRDHGTFDLEQAPTAEFDPEAIARHGRILRSWMSIVFPAVKRNLAEAR